jgi:hypothetical protein
MMVSISINSLLTKQIADVAADLLKRENEK